MAKTRTFLSFFTLTSIPLIFATMLTSSYTLENNYFLSVNGSDQWDGTSDTIIPGTSQGPWQTFSHAIGELRKLRPNPPTVADTVTLNFLPGTYFLPQIQYLDKRESFLTFASYSNGDVIISGGTEINLEGIKTDSTAKKSVVFDGKCGEAFEGGVRLIPARSPNAAKSDEPSKNNLGIGPNHYIKNLLVETDTCKRNTTSGHQTCPEEDKTGFIFDGSLFSNDWDDLDQSKILVYHSWIAEYARIKSITPDGTDWKVIFQEPLHHAPVGEYVNSGGWRFIFYNNLALLDDPGEYVCIERDGASEFIYIPHQLDKAGKDKGGASSVVISQLGVMIQISKANHVSFKGIKFQHSSSEGFMGSWNWGTEAAVKVLSSSDISFEDCELSHHGMIGLYFRDTGRIHLDKNLFHDVGYHALMIQYDGSYETTDILVENNIFNGCGMNHFWQPSCMWIGGRENITIRHNDIGNVPYAGMIVKAHNPIDGHIRKSNEYVYNIEFNDFHDYGLGILNDFGAVYIAMGNEDCTTHDINHMEERCRVHTHVYNNRIRRGKAYYNGANNLYSDDGSSYNTFENNIMYGEGENALYHHCGIENLSKNNVIHRTANNFRSRDTPSRYNNVWAGCEKTNAASQAYENQRNIYLLDDIEGFTFGRSFDQFYDAAPEFHHNMYWCLAPGNPQDEKIYPGKLSWFEWQESGNDTDSVWQDPLFEDPDNHIYVLKPNSPALDLGITQIDLDHFGPQNTDQSKAKTRRHNFIN